MTDYVEENITATYTDSRIFKSVPPGGSPISEGEWPVVVELPAWQALGLPGREIETLLGQAEWLTEDQTLELSAAWDAAWNAAWDIAQSDAWDAFRHAAWRIARGAGRGTAWDAAQSAFRTAVQDAIQDADWSAARGTAWDTAWYVIRGLLILDLEPALAEILLAPWVSVMGRSWEVTA